MDKTIKKEAEIKKSNSEAHFAKAVSYNLPISTKQSVEICSFVRNKPVEKAKLLLNSVIEKKIAVPYKRYNKDTPHRKGKIAAGRYPIKSVDFILKVIHSAEANAENKGLDSKNLIIKEIKASKGPHHFHPGRKRRRLMKNTHIEVRLEEK